VSSVPATLTASLGPARSAKAARLEPPHDIGRQGVRTWYSRCQTGLGQAKAGVSWRGCQAGTRARVERASVSLQFVRHESARQLRAGSSQLLVFVMLEAGDPTSPTSRRDRRDGVRSRPLVDSLQQQRNRRTRGRLPRSLGRATLRGALTTPVKPGGDLLSQPANRETPVAWSTAPRPGERTARTHLSVSVDDPRRGICRDSPV
jgi:hypothetical protein